jgi:hypothetical protein
MMLFRMNASGSFMNAVSSAVGIATSPLRHPSSGILLRVGEEAEKFLRCIRMRQAGVRQARAGRLF